MDEDQKKEIKEMIDVIIDFSEDVIYIIPICLFFYLLQTEGIYFI